jgi:hypothetical protein
MAVGLNEKGVEHARALIGAGKVDRTAGWSIDAEEENAMLGDPPGWGAYSGMFLGHDPGANPETKEAWKYPVGKGGKVYRSALLAIRQRAGQQKAAEIEAAAGKLLEAVDGKQRTEGGGTASEGAGRRKDFAESKKRIEIFRAGRHTSSDGQEIEFSEGDLEATARAYDPKVHDAPLVVGHPRTDDPAYGWVTDLDRSGGSLFAEADQVDPEFADLVRAGRYRKVSASFYTPTSPQNPVPGVYYLRHVGFLGAQPPALKGLKPVGFADSDNGVIEFNLTATRRGRQMPKELQAAKDFHEGGEKISASLWRRMREFFIRKHGQDEADDVIPREIIAALEEESRRDGEEARRGRTEGEGAEGHAFSETALSQREIELKRREAEFAEKQKAFLAKEKAARRDGFAAFCDGIIKEGRMLPVNKAPAIALLEYVASADGAPSIEFGEGTDKKSLAPAEIFKLILASQPKAVTYGETVRGGEAIPDGEDAMREAKIAEFMEKHKGVSYRDAMIEVSREFPNLFGLAVKAK